MLQKIADGVFVHQSELLQNNTVVVQGNTGVLVVDPGITRAELACLASDIRELGQTVVAGFSTHPDWDHALWTEELGSAPRYSTAQAASFLQDFLSKDDWKEQLAQGLPPENANDIPLDLFGKVTALTEDTTHLPWDGPSIRVIGHRAHAQGHAALFIEDSGILIAGDMLSDVFMPMLDLQAAQPLDDYVAALQLFDEIAADVVVIVPGHGSVATGDQVGARIAQDHAYIKALRGNTPVHDPRIDAPKQGWEWVSDIHNWQTQQIVTKNNQPDAPGANS